MQVARQEKNPDLKAAAVARLGAWTLPGVREAIEEERWADATQYIGLTAGTINAYSDRLDQATAVLKR